jgi:hypothetical protein
VLSSYINNVHTSLLSPPSLSPASSGATCSFSCPLITDHPRDSDTAYPVSGSQPIFTRPSSCRTDLCMRIRIVQYPTFSNTFPRCLLRDTPSSLPAVHHHLSGFSSPRSVPPTSQARPPHPQNTKLSFTTFHRPRLSPLRNKGSRSCLRHRQVTSGIL